MCVCVSGFTHSLTSSKIKAKKTSHVPAQNPNPIPSTSKFPPVFSFPLFCLLYIYFFFFSGEEEEEDEKQQLNEQHNEQNNLSYYLMFVLFHIFFFRPLFFLFFFSLSPSSQLCSRFCLFCSPFSSPLHALSSLARQVRQVGQVRQIDLQS